RGRGDPRSESRMVLPQPAGASSGARAPAFGFGADGSVADRRAGVFALERRCDDRRRAVLAGRRSERLAAAHRHRRSNAASEAADRRRGPAVMFDERITLEGAAKAAMARTRKRLTFAMGVFAVAFAILF